MPCSKISVVHVSDCNPDYMAAPVLALLLLNAKSRVAEWLCMPLAFMPGHVVISRSTAVPS